MLIEAHGMSLSDIELKVIRTIGDAITDKSLREFGGKGLFTKEIEDDLLEARIDLAVHSMKDMPTQLPEGLEINCLLPREDVRDAFISPHASGLLELREGAVIGTASLRRQAQIRQLRPDMKIVMFRGNVQTRLRKLAEGEADATLLACAGLNRLGLADKVTQAIDVETMLPAVAQGAIGVEAREGDERISTLLVPLNDRGTSLCVAAERAFLARLDGSCQTPIAGLAELEGDRMRFRGHILTPDGGESHATQRKGLASEGVAMAEDAADELLSHAGPNFFKSD